MHGVLRWGSLATLQQLPVSTELQERWVETKANPQNALFAAGRWSSLRMGETESANGVAIDRRMSDAVELPRKSLRGEL